MSDISQESVWRVLATIKHPGREQDIASLGMVAQLRLDGSDLQLTLKVDSPAAHLKDRLEADVNRALRSELPAIKKVRINFQLEALPPAGQPSPGQPAPGQPARLLPEVKHIIAVASGKGGVGKSTVAANLALALKQEGLKVGLLDADIYGPSVGILFGVPEGEKPKVVGESRIQPLIRYGLPLMSMGFLLGKDDAVIWRGPMLGKMLHQFLQQVDWGTLDYLILDLPPGTGDVQLSLSQMLPLTGAVVVTTPQEIAFSDVRRAIKMFEQTNVPVLGIVENMSHFVCDACETSHRIFGGSDDPQHYRDLNLEILARIPLEKATQKNSDSGKPIVVSEPGSQQAFRFGGLARRLIQQVQT